MTKCAKCGKKIGVFEEDKRFYKKDSDRLPTCYCLKCYEQYLVEKDEIKRIELEEIIAKAPKIRCPYCEEWFPKLTNEQYRDSAELNVLKWLIVPAWGVVGALKNKPFIECPHCKMKIMQG